jgi:hypothetical protein
VTTTPLRAQKVGVQTVYTEQDASTLIRAKKDAGKSLRAIASEYGEPVNHADIERILQGKFPHDQAKRKALHLAPICISCGQKVKPARVIPGWVDQAVEFLKSRETLHHGDAENTEKTKIRVYSRGGKRVPA